jgi:hypothetical protein
MLALSYARPLDQARNSADDWNRPEQERKYFSRLQRPARPNQQNDQCGRADKSQAHRARHEQPTHGPAKTDEHGPRRYRYDQRDENQPRENGGLSVGEDWVNNHFGL